MTTNTMPHQVVHAGGTTTDWTRFLVPVGRLCFSLIFLQTVFLHFSRAGIDYAAKQGVPWASFAVPLSGVLAILGGLSVLLGYHTRVGAVLLILFLVPVTLLMHAFWNVSDPMMSQMQMIMFMKNVSILGGALLLAHFGAGPISLDARRRRGETEPG